MRAWFEEHGFRSGPEDEAALASYAARGWCFATARIARDAGTAPTEEGLIPALMLLFPAPEPVYPFALTATAGGEIEVLLYILAKGKVTHPALELKYAGPFVNDWITQGFLDWIDWSDTSEVDFKPDYPQPPGFLSKLKGWLSSANVAGDLVFSAADDDQPYQEVYHRWW